MFTKFRRRRAKSLFYCSLLFEIGMSSAFEITVISNATHSRLQRLKLNIFFLGVSELQLVLFLHISKTDQLKGQRGLCSHGIKNLKRVARTHFIVSHRRQEASFTSKSLKPPELTAVICLFIPGGPGVSWDSWRSNSFGLSGGCVDAHGRAQPPTWGMRQSRCLFQVSLIYVEIYVGFEWRFVSGEEMGNSCQLQCCCIDRGGHVLYLDNTRPLN